MKTKITLLLITLMAISTSIIAQSISNSSFENWTSKTLYEEPDSFQTSNMYSYMMGAAGNVVKSTDAYSGIYSIKLSTIININDTVPGILILGEEGLGEELNGIPYTDKPDSIKLAVKHNILNSDTASLIAMFMKNGAVIGIAMKTFLGVQNSWSLVSIPVIWIPPAILSPDTMVFFITSSSLDGDKIPGSWLQADALELTGGVTQIPNGGMENWTPVAIEEPDDWWTINFAGIYDNNYSVTKSTDAHHGTYAARIETIEVFDDTMGFLTNGHLGDDGPMGGMAVNQNPHKLSGYYKYTPVGPDSALVGLFSLDYTPTDTTVVDSNLVKLPAAYTYTYFEVPLTYDGWPIIDTLNITFASSNIEDDLYYVGLGSVLYIDSLNLSYKPLSINENADSKNEFRVFPNPADNIINITTKLPVNSDLQISVYNSIGKLVLEKTLNPLSLNDFFKLDISNLKPAIYIYKIQTDEDIINGKIIKK